MAFYLCSSFALLCNACSWTWLPGFLCCYCCCHIVVDVARNILLKEFFVPSSFAFLINNPGEKDHMETCTTVKELLSQMLSLSTLVDLVDIKKLEVVHKVNTKLFSISFPQLCSLQKLCLESTNFDYSSVEYKVTVIILDIANYRF